MMMKALQSYGRYQGPGGFKRTFSKSGTPVWDDKLSHRAMASNHGHHSKEVLTTGSYSQDTYESASSEKSTNFTFKLAQCQLRYYDDHEEEGRRRKRSITSGNKSSTKSKLFQNKTSPKDRPSAISRSANECGLYPREKMDGVLVDSIGHVYRTCQTSRPKSALPCKFSDFVKLSGREFAWDRRADSTSHIPVTSTREATQTHKRPISGRADRTLKPAGIETRENNIASRPSTAGSLKVINLRLDGAALPTRNMAGQPIPHSEAFDRRNRTTHAWGDNSSLSQSMPSASFLHRQYGTRSLGGSSASSPRYSKGEPRSYSERTSPAGKPSDPSKPSASYSYDGGFFVGAHSGKAEYFVIHPDWVSEVMTIKKLSVNTSRGGNKTKGAPPLSQSAHFRPRSLQGRRCLSAPPQKRRNPITWVDSQFLADASNFDACDNTVSSNSVAINGDRRK
ncbi:hypothetical protein ElyMa_006754700 [Elysia marginata]|uniref:Uncharacterized protein n=1 Tax=Elysia marginata TaxID=1093978 RepID=A0AAV4IYS2_9GAST|nr:hypothetical protein ElyMa_006754700 [Elysia marginata]